MQILHKAARSSLHKSLDTVKNLIWIFKVSPQPRFSSSSFGIFWKCKALWFVGCIDKFAKQGSPGVEIVLLVLLQNSFFGIYCFDSDFGCFGFWI